MTVPTARESVDRIPVIDFDPFLNGGAAGRQDVARQIAHACETIGFFYLKNHGVPQSKIDAVFAAARAFFALPKSVLMREGMVCSATNSKGYAPLGSRRYAGTGAADLMEAFKMQLELPPDDPDIVAGNRVHQRNRWPEGEAEFRATLLDYFDQVTRLSHALLRAFAWVLELEPEYFLRCFRKPLTQLSLIHYPEQPPSAPEDEFGVRPHVDATAVTILAQDQVGGLQVKGVGDTWIDARPIPDTYVVNIGDVMARWTNDRFCSTFHRVFNRTGRDRYSVPFFVSPDFDTLVQRVPTRLKDGEEPKYPPITMGEFLARKNARDWVGNEKRAS
jgi:isopenicillin N synthase-like dioxygenase